MTAVDVLPRLTGVYCLTPTAACLCPVLRGGPSCTISLSLGASSCSFGCPLPYPAEFNLRLWWRGSVLPFPSEACVSLFWIPGTPVLGRQPRFYLRWLRLLRSHHLLSRGASCQRCREEKRLAQLSCWTSVGALQLHLSAVSRPANLSVPRIMSCIPQHPSRWERGVSRCHTTQAEAGQSIARGW